VEEGEVLAARLIEPVNSTVSLEFYFQIFNSSLSYQLRSSKQLKLRDYSIQKPPKQLVYHGGVIRPAHRRSSKTLFCSIAFYLSYSEFNIEQMWGHDKNGTG
jgi:hypothetical protein